MLRGFIAQRPATKGSRADRRVSYSTRNRGRRTCRGLVKKKRSLPRIDVALELRQVRVKDLDAFYLCTGGGN